MSSVNLTEFINIKEAREEEAASILVHIKHYRSQQEYEPIIKHAIQEVTKGLLSSQNKGMDCFNVVTIFPLDFEHKNMDMKLVIKLSQILLKLFPDKLLKYYIYNPPRMFNIMWSLMKGIIGKELAGKVVVIKSDNTMVTNLDEICV